MYSAPERTDTKKEVIITTTRGTLGFFKNYIPTTVLLLIVIIAAIWAYSSGIPQKASMPSVSAITIILLLIIGFAAGLLGGIIGTGGCSVMLPAIHFWMGYPVPIAVGTTLFAVIFTALSGGYGHLVRRNLDVRATLYLGISGILGVFLGSWFFTLLTSHIKFLGLIFGLAFFWPAVRMICEGLRKGGIKTQEGNAIPGPRWGWIVFGFIIGVTTGILGVGGGYALVPGLIYLFGAPVYITMGTSLATIIPLAIVGGGIKLVQGYVVLVAGLILATGTIIGAQIGAAIIKRFNPSTLKLIFGVYFFYVSIKFIFGFFGINIW